MEIDGKEYVLKYTFRMYYVYEEARRESYNGGVLGTNFLFFCCLTINNDGFRMNFEDFTDYLYKKPNNVNELLKFLETNLTESKKKAATERD